MKISELIKHLNLYENKFGDITVKIPDIQNGMSFTYVNIDDFIICGNELRLVASN